MPNRASSGFGKLDVIRHLIAGDDCAIAGMATLAAATVPAATAPGAPLRKSRRFIRHPPRSIYGKGYEPAGFHSASCRWLATDWISNRSLSIQAAILPAD
ncbi:hypothetical protein CHELA1G11_14565 [Hyphomicrobiales bacterium]|nr:hypothetical protein CHELA1G2_14543 [Hyphomicrobiales bacterium]CAH1679490.1 hypothetical protein CHELA1G11_14565 [Hyphomicrobiales bacterium]